MMMMMIRVPENYILVISRRSLDKGLRKGLKERERIIMHPLEKTETTMGRWEMRWMFAFLATRLEERMRDSFPFS